MKIIGRINNILYCYIEGARIIVSSKLDDISLNDVIEYGNIPNYSSIYFVELGYFGESQYSETEPITNDDKSVLTKSKLTEADYWDGDESDNFLQ